MKRGKWKREIGKRYEARKRKEDEKRNESEKEGDLKYEKLPPICFT